MAGRKPVPFNTRFWEKVDKTGECWIWTALKTGGYGRFSVITPRGRTMGYAHRIAYELTHGPIADGLEVLHRCDNPSCVNPDHLVLGSHAENMAEMSQKGRVRKTFGSKNGSARLTAEQVQAIRRRYAAKGVTQRELAREYGVTDIHIGFLVRRKYWKDLPD